MCVQPGLAFVFTGQRARWAQFPVVRAALRDFRYVLARLFGPPEWDMLEALAQPETKSSVHEAEFSHDLATALQIAMVDLLRSWGIQSTAVVGYSLGESQSLYHQEQRLSI